MSAIKDVALPDGLIGLRAVGPFDWASMRVFLQRRLLPGIEKIDGSVYYRTINIGDQDGVLSVQDWPDGPGIAVRLWHPDPAVLAPLSRRLRRQYDLDADTGAIGGHLMADPLLRGLVAARPHVRIPGSWDVDELAIRAIAGQQVSVEAAAGVVARIARAAGRPLAMAGGNPVAGLDWIFPKAADVAHLDPTHFAMPQARAQTIRHLMGCATDPTFWQGDPGAVARHLVTMPGIGDWTAQYIALRALNDADAFPAGDLILRRRAASGDTVPSVRDLRRLAEAWRPYRAYAAIHLWLGGSS